MRQADAAASAADIQADRLPALLQALQKSDSRKREYEPEPKPTC